MGKEQKLTMDYMELREMLKELRDIVNHNYDSAVDISRAVSLARQVHESLNHHKWTLYRAEELERANERINRMAQDGGTWAD